MKRFLTLLLVTLLIVSTFTGCGSSKNEPAPSSNEQQSEQSEGTEENKEPVTITYATWGDPEVEQAMIDAFMEEYPHITVVKDENIVWPWNDSLAAAASSGNLPDVFWLENVPVPVSNEWLMDLKPFLDKDEEAKAIYGNLLEDANYNGKQYGMPRAQFLLGFFVNKDLLGNYNIDIPEYEWKFDEFKDIVKKATDINNNVYGLIGVWPLREVLPAQFDNSMGWATWDGEKYNFSKQPWIDAINETHNLAKNENVALDAVEWDKKVEIYGDDPDGVAWKTGKVAVRWGGTWDLGWMSQELDFDYDFYPVPGGEKGQRIPIVVDYIGVSSTTEHPEAAYEFMKWMSFSKKGWEKKLEIYKEQGKSVAEMPIFNNDEVWTKYLSAGKSLPGVKHAIEMIGEGFIDPIKTVPGYAKSYWEVGPGAEWPLMESGELNPADKANEYEEKANAAYQEAIESLK